MEEYILKIEKPVAKREPLEEVRKRAFPLRFCPVCKRHLPLGKFRTASNELRDSCADCFKIYVRNNNNKKSRRWK